LIFNQGHADVKMPDLRDRVNFALRGMDWGGWDYLPDLNLRKSATVHAAQGTKSTGQIGIGGYSGADGRGSLF
jgi:hypothetical protein